MVMIHFILYIEKKIKKNKMGSEDTKHNNILYLLPYIALDFRLLLNLRI